MACAPSCMVISKLDSSVHVFGLVPASAYINSVVDMLIAVRSEITTPVPVGPPVAV